MLFMDDSLFTSFGSASFDLGDGADGLRDARRHLPERFQVLTSDLTNHFEEPNDGHCRSRYGDESSQREPGVEQEALNHQGGDHQTAPQQRCHGVDHGKLNPNAKKNTFELFGYDFMVD